MDSNYEGNAFPDVDFKPGADYEVDDTLFQGMTMKEDFLDFDTDHVYCSAESDTRGRVGVISGILDVGNEVEIEEEIIPFQDVVDGSEVDEIRRPMKKMTKMEDLKVLSTLDEGVPADKKKVCQVPLVKTYNMRSKRSAVDDGKIEFAGRNTGGKGGQAAKRRKVDQSKAAKNEEASDEEENEDDEVEEELDEDEESEEEEVEEEEVVQNKRKSVSQSKKGTKVKGKRKGKAAKVKKTVKGKPSPKKSAKQMESDEEEEDDEDDDEMTPEDSKKSKKSKLKEKLESAKRRGRPKRKQEMDSSDEEEEQEEEDEEEEEDSENGEEVEVPQKSGKTKQKRPAKGRVKQPAAKKKKAVKKLGKKVARASDSETASSDSLPLQEIKKQNKKKVLRSGGNQGKLCKEESEENSTGEEEETENVQTGAGKTGYRDPVLSAVTKGAAFLTDDSASICSNEDGTPVVRTSSRIKKPNRLYVTGNANSQPVGKATANAQKREKQSKAKATDQQTTNANLDLSESTDTDALVIIESPLKFPPSSVSNVAKQPLPSYAEVKGAEAEEPELEEDDERENPKGSSESLIHSSESGALDASEGIKRSPRIKHLDEVNREKFKALRAERERLEGRQDLQKRKSQDKVESETDKEEKPKQVTKEVVKPNVAVTMIKNPCRGPNCGNGSLPGSVYCSDDCIQNHAEESICLIEQERLKSQPQRPRTEATVAALKSEERIVVFERKTGKLLTGPVAPTESTLLAWLKKHPTFEVLQPSHHAPSSHAVKKDKKPENKKTTKEIRIPLSKEIAKTAVPPSDQPPVGGVKEERMKAVVPSQQQQQQQQRLNTERSKPVNIHREFGQRPPRDMHGESSYSRGGPDPARISIRNTLRETLLARANETDDVMLSGSEIKRLALDIEQELFGYYSEVNTKYKHKYRTLITHLKDPTNKGLFRKVLFGEVKPNRLVRLSSENLGSRELANWKDPHSKFAQETASEPKSAKKSDFSLPPKSPFYDPSYDCLSSIIVDTTCNHGNHFFDINCKICTGKIPEPLYYDASKVSSSSSANVVSSKEEVVSAGIDVEPPATTKVAKDDERVSSATGVSRDPRRSKATVTAVTSGSSLSIVATRSEEKSVVVLSPPNITSPVQTTMTEISSNYKMGQMEPLILWKGSIYAHDVTKVAVCAYLVSGSLAVLKEDLSDLIVISGRLPPDNVYYYLSHIKQSGSFQRDVAVLRFESAGAQNDELYNQLFNYLHSRDRCGVVSGCSGPSVKDVYIVPVASGHALPAVLLPFVGPGLPDNHPNLLLGVILKHSSKQPGLSSPGSVKPVSTKTWMYSERALEAKEELGPETHHYGYKHGTKQVEASVATTEKQNSVEELTPKVEFKVSKAPDKDDTIAAESSGTSDIDEDLSEVARKDPIVSKYSKFDKKKSLKTSAFEKTFDDDKPYDPFDGEEDKQYDPASPEFISMTKVTTTTTTTVSASSSSKYSSSSTGSLVSGSVSVLNSTSSVAGGVDVTQLFKPVSGLSNATDMTTAMLTTLAAISTTSNTEEQRRLLAELTDKINEQKLHLDKERQDLKNDESLGFSRGNLPPSNSVSAKQSGSENTQKLHSESLFQFLDSHALASAAELIPGSSQAELSSSVGNYSAEISSANAWANSSTDNIKLLPTTASNLSQMPVDSAAIMNLARKRLAQKAGDLHHLTPKVENLSSEFSASDKKPNLSASLDITSSGNEQNTTAKSNAEAISTFSCNLSVLPPSIQQLLSGSSFENLKNIVANATGKKVSDADGSKAVKIEPPKYEVDDVMAGRSLDKERVFVHHKNEDTLASDDLTNFKTLFPSNMHGDVDYRVQSGSSDVIPKSFEMKMGSNVDARTRLSHSSAFPPQKPTDSVPFRPSMQALLETPPDSISRNTSEVKQPLLKTPGASDEAKSLPPEMNRPPFPPYMQPPPFPSNLSRLPSDMQNLPYRSDAEKAPLDSDGQRPPFHKTSFRSEVPRPPLLPDVPKPPFPPQLSRPPFPPGIQRPPFLPEPPRPPIMPDHLRASAPMLAGRNDMVSASQASGGISRSSGSGLLPIPSPGIASAKNQTDPPGKIQADYSSPSDKYFVPKPIGSRSVQKTSDQSNVVESNKSFAVGDVLKHLDGTKNNRGSMARSSSASSISGQNKPKSLQQSSGDDENLRERKVLLPTPPPIQSRQKSSERKASQDAEDSVQEKKQEKTDRRREVSESRKSENKKQELRKPETNSSHTAFRNWSAKSDWETKKSNKAGSSEGTCIILIDDDTKPCNQMELEQIPLPPTLSPPQGGQASGGRAEDEKAKENKSTHSKAENKQDEDKICNADNSDKDKPSEGRRHSKHSPSRGLSGENGKSGTKKSAKDSSTSRTRDSERERRRSRLADRHKRSRGYPGRRRSRSRSKERPSAYHSRSSDRRSSAERQRRLSRDRRRSSPLLDVRKREGDGGSLIKERSYDGNNTNDQLQSERRAILSNPILQTEMKPSILGIPSLMGTIETAESTKVVPPIPSLLDIMGVHRARDSQSDLKNSGDVATSSTSGLLGMKYCRDYKHGSDLRESRERDGLMTSEVSSEEQFNSRGLFEMTKRREFDPLASGRMPESRDHRRPLLGHHYQVDAQERRDSAAEMGGTTAGIPPRRPLIDRPPDRDFERPSGTERALYEGDATTSDAGFRYNRFGNNRAGERIDSGRWEEYPEVNRMKGDPVQLHSSRSFSSEPHFERKPLLSTEANEADLRFFNPSALKKSLLGDYPGISQGPDEEKPDDVHKERNINTDERHMTQSSLEQYKTGDGHQSLSLQSRPIFARPMTGIRPGFGSVASQRHPLVCFDERGITPRNRPRMPQPPQFGISPDRMPPASESQQSWRNANPYGRQSENRGQPYLPSDSDADAVSEKKTLLPMPDPTGSTSSEMPGSRSQPTPPHLMDVPSSSFMMRPGMGARMSPRLLQHRHSGFPEGSRVPGIRPKVPGDPRFRGQLMR